jgi:ribosomal protein S18 acetylase RimI-like enzyme
MVTIAQAQVDDAEAIAALGARVFGETFSHATPPGDMRRFLEETFRPELQRAEVEDPQRRVLVARIEGELAGFAMVRRHHAEPQIKGPDPIELQRLYVDGRWHGRGVAQALMAEAFAFARGAGHRTIWLGVWEHNQRAQRFYRKYGFEVCGSHVFPVGGDPQIDLLMSRPL